RAKQSPRVSSFTRGATCQRRSSVSCSTASVSTTRANLLRLRRMRGSPCASQLANACTSPRAIPGSKASRASGVMVTSASKLHGPTGLVWVLDNDPNGGGRELNVGGANRPNFPACRKPAVRCAVLLIRLEKQGRTVGELYFHSFR